MDYGASLTKSIKRGELVDTPLELILNLKENEEMYRLIIDHLESIQSRWNKIQHEVRKKRGLFVEDQDPSHESNNKKKRIDEDN